MDTDRVSKRMKLQVGLNFEVCHFSSSFNGKRQAKEIKKISCTYNSKKQTVYVIDNTIDFIASQRSRQFFYDLYLYFESDPRPFAVIL